MSLQWNSSFSVDHFEVGGHQVVVLGELGQVVSQEGWVEQLVGNIKVIKDSTDSERDEYISLYKNVCQKGYMTSTRVEQLVHTVLVCM